MADEASKLDRILLIVVTSIIGLIATMMAFTYITQYLQSRDFAARFTGQASADPAFAVLIIRMGESSLLRISSFFLSFVLIYVGALYVLRTAQASFSASVEGGGLKTALQTTSPGLVLAALGVTLILITNYTSPRLDYQSTPSQGATGTSPTTLKSLPAPDPLKNQPTSP